MKMIQVLWLFFAFAAAGLASESEAPSMRMTRAVAAGEAVQAAAADDRFIYAVSNAVIGKYDRATGERIAISTGAAKHLNSAFVFEGKVYCAHSNFPAKPEHSEIKVLDPATMQLTSFKDFGESNGSLTWAVNEGGTWWCTFAFYDAENAKTRLVKFDANWRELQEWTYPPEVVKELGKYSISGGLWRDGILLATGHDRRVIYRLQLPEQGNVLKLVGTIRSPFPGQGIAFDPVEKGLLGIDRKAKQVIFAQLPE